MTIGICILVAVVCLAAGSAIGFMAAGSGARRRAEIMVTEAREQVRMEEKTRYEDLARQMEAKERELREAMERRHGEALQAQERMNAEAIEAMKRNFTESVATLRQEVNNSTKTLLEERQKEFSTSSSESLQRIMEPLQSDIRRMQEAVKENTEKNTDYSGQLKTGIENVLRQSREAAMSADRLANALSVGNKVQGNWGETILSEILEATGLKEGEHFFTQEFIRDSSGEKVMSDRGDGMQPDVVLKLGNGHKVVIDAKVSLTDFFRYNDAETEPEREQYLKKHVAGMKAQVKKLSDKDYASHLPGALDYVIMFVPVTQAVYVATREDPGLWREAMEKKVYIADEQTLYAALKIIELNWKQQTQAENQEKVYMLANEMLKRVEQFMDKFVSIGTSIGKAQQSYEAAYSKLTAGGQSIPTTCNKLIKLGAKYDSKKGLLPELLGTADEQ